MNTYLADASSKYLLTTKEIEEMFSISPDVIEAREKKGELRAVVIEGIKYYFRNELISQDPHKRKVEFR